MIDLNRLKPVAFLLCLLPAAVLAWDFWGVTHNRPDALGANPIRAAEIYTGLWTLRFLAITLAVTPVRELFGLGALAMWVGVDWYFDWQAMGGEIVKHKYILIGMTTFVLLLPLALTSTKGSVRRLGGARWARLHRLIYLCAITGTVHYLWAVKKDTLFPLIYLLVFGLLLGFRLCEHYVGPLRLRARPARRTPARRAAPIADATTNAGSLGDAR